MGVSTAPHECRHVDIPVDSRHTGQAAECHSRREAGESGLEADSRIDLEGCCCELGHKRRGGGGTYGPYC